MKRDGPHQDRHLGLLLPRRSGAADLHRQDAAVRRAVGRALGDVERRAGGDDPEPGRRHAEAATSRSPTTRDWLDGLVLQGGSDVSPRATARRRCSRSGAATASATTTRSALLAAFARARQAGVRHLPRPAAAERGVRRHAATRTSPRSGPARCEHRDAAIYDRNFHAVEFVPGSRLARALRGRRRGRSSTASTTRRIKDLAPGFVVEARCPDDGMIEAIRRPERQLHGRRAVASRVPPRAAKARSTTRRCSTTSSPPRAPRSNRMTTVSQIVNPANGERSPSVPADDAASVAAKAGARARGAAGVGGDAARRAQGAASRAFAPRVVRELETLAATLTREVGKPIGAVAQRAERPARPRIDFFLAEVERGDRRRDGVRRRRHARAHRPRAARRGRQHLGLELPVLRRRQRVRAGAADRQRGALQAVGVRDADRPAHRPAAARGRRAGTTCSSPLVGGGEVGAALLEQRDRRPLLHRLATPPARASPQAVGPRMVQAAARARRQGPDLRRATTPTRRRRPSRSPTARCTTPARAAARSSASTCTSGSTTPSSTPSSTTVKGFKVGDPIDRRHLHRRRSRARRSSTCSRRRWPTRWPRARRCAPAASASRGPGNWFEPTVLHRRRPHDGG